MTADDEPDTSATFRRHIRQTIAAAREKANPTENTQDTEPTEDA